MFFRQNLKNLMDNSSKTAQLSQVTEQVRGVEYNGIHLMI